MNLPKIAAAILVVAATATLADWVWYTVGVGHTMAAGLIHGALVMAVVGTGLGAVAGRPLRGLPVGFVAGIGGALAYYLFVAVLDPRPYGTAIPASWVVTWLLMAVLEGRWLRAPAVRPWTAIAVRGLVAALLGGIAFWLVLETLWGAPPPGGRSYPVQLAAWAFAWAPGMLALSLGDRRAASE